MKTSTPSFPTNYLPPFWADWVVTTAGRLGVPTDYVAAGLLAAVAGAAGSGIAAEPVPDWREPLLLRLAAIGEPGAGKSRTLAIMRRLLDPAPGTAAERAPDPAMLWHDELADRPKRLSLGQAPLGIAGTLRPDGLAAFAKDETLAARFLYFWPASTEYQSLCQRVAVDLREAQARLARIAALARDAENPLVLPIAAAALPAFDAFCAAQHQRIRHSLARPAAWTAKAGGTVAVLAAMLALLDWAARGEPAPPGEIDSRAVACAMALHDEYFRPRAMAVLSRPPLEQAVERATRWMRHTGAETVSREELRRKALGYTLDAAGTAEVIAELEARGMLAPIEPTEPPGRGRPSPRWQVQLGSLRKSENPKIDATFDLPPIKAPDDLLPAMRAVGRAMTERKITPGECRALGAFVKTHADIIEVVDFAPRLAKLEQADEARAGAP